MRRSSPVPPKRRQGAFAAQSMLRSSCLDVVLVDGNPRRTLERELYGAKCREVEAVTVRLETFEKQEMPAFSAWVEREFEREITTLRREQSAVRDLQELALDVERYAAWTDVSYDVALERLSRAKAEGTEAELWKEAFGADDDQFDEDDDEFEHDFAEDDAEAFARAFAGDFAEDAAFGRAGASRHAAAPRPKSSEEQQGENYLKALYRQLVRALHPDSNPDQADQALWQEVQDAYSWGDIGRLERLQKAVLKTGDRGLNLDAAPIGDIIGLRKSVESRLKKLRGAVRTAKGHPAWDFMRIQATQTRLRQLRRQIGLAMADDLALMQHERRQLEMWVDSFRAKRRTRPTPNTRSKPSAQKKSRKAKPKPSAPRR